VGEEEHGFRAALRDRVVLLAIAGNLVVMLGFGIVAPVLPNYARTFGVGYDAVGLLISSFSLMRLISDPFVGRFIDRHGERSMTALGAAVVGLSALAAAFAPTFALLVAFRSVGGIGSALFFAGLLSFLLRSVPPGRTGRVMSLYYGSFNLGVIVGGPIGGIVAKWFGLASPLYLYGAACLLAAWLFWRTLRDPARPPQEARSGGLRRLPWSRSFVAVLVANLAYLWFSAAVFSTLLPLFAREEVGLGLGGVGIALAIAAAAELVALFPAGRATDRRGRKAVFVPSLAGLAVVTASLGFASDPAVFLGSMAVLGVVSGFAGVPAAPMLSDVTPEDVTGTAVAAFRFAGDLGFVIGPLVAGWAASGSGFEAAFATAAVPTLAALALVLSIRETMPMLPRTGEAAGL
jgi:MFS family permease